MGCRLERPFPGSLATICLAVSFKAFTIKGHAIDLSDYQQREAQPMRRRSIGILNPPPFGNIVVIYPLGDLRSQYTDISSAAKLSPKQS